MSIILDEFIRVLTTTPPFFGCTLNDIVYYSFGIIFFIAGIDHGFQGKGTENYKEIFENGMAVGLSLGFIVGFLTYPLGLVDSLILIIWIKSFFGNPGSWLGKTAVQIPAWFFSALLSTLRFFIPTLIYTLIFLGGVYIGDIIKKKWF